MQLDLTEAQVEFLRCVLEEDLDRNRDHLDWLRSEEACEEEDKPQQQAECEHSIELGAAILLLLGESDGPRPRASWPLATMKIGASFISPIDERLTRQYVSVRARTLKRKFTVTKTPQGLQVTRTK
jgi:hypothetical protein